MTDPTFRTVLRGYDPAEVERAVTQLRQAVEQARAEAADRVVEVAKLRNQLEQLQVQLNAQTSRIEELSTAQLNATPPGYAELGERIGSMLSLADREAQELLANARAQADKVTTEAQTASEKARSGAEQHAQEVISKADADAAAILENAKRQADDILDHADREATTRREEAEAVYENQRARAAEAAADFEKTLAARRDHAMADFAEQMRASEAALARAADQQNAMQVEAERTLADAKAQAAAIVKEARDQAGALVDEARLNADKIRRESERELLATTSRRDAITAQLANVRQMLATLGAGTMLTTSQNEPNSADNSPAGTQDSPAAADTGNAATDSPVPGGSSQPPTGDDLADTITIHQPVMDPPVTDTTQMDNQAGGAAAEDAGHADLASFWAPWRDASAGR